MKRFVSVTPAAVFAVAAMIVLAVPGGSCRAGPLLGLTFATGGPSVSGANGALSYDATTGDFHASGPGPAGARDFSSLIFSPAGQPTNLVFLDPANGTASLTIDLKVDHNGNFVADGS